MKTDIKIQYSSLDINSEIISLEDRTYEYIYGILTKGSDNEFNLLLLGINEGFIYFFKKFISENTFKSNEFFFIRSKYIFIDRIARIVNNVPAVASIFTNEFHQILLQSLFFRIYNIYSSPMNEVMDTPQIFNDFKKILLLEATLFTNIILCNNFSCELDHYKFEDLIKKASNRKITFFTFFIENFLSTDREFTKFHQFIKLIVENDTKIILNDPDILQSSYELLLTFKQQLLEKKSKFESSLTKTKSSGRFPIHELQIMSVQQSLKCISTLMKQARLNSMFKFQDLEKISGPNNSPNCIISSLSIKLQ